MLFQQGALFSSLTVLENVASPLVEHTKLPKDTIRELAEMKIAMVGLKPESHHQKPAELSGGMRKRVGLARALALDPELLFLDEPTAGLDPIGAAAFDELIRNLSDDLGLTVFMITHDLDSLYAICDKVAVLADKHVVEKATVQELEKSDHPWIKEYFLGPRGRAATKARLRDETRWNETPITPPSASPPSPCWRRWRCSPSGWPGCSSTTTTTSTTSSSTARCAACRKAARCISTASASARSPT